MKRVLASVLMVALAVGLMTGAQAQEPLRIGVLDVRKVILDSKPGQAHRAERDKLVKERREQIAKEEAAIRALQEKLDKDKLVLTDKQKEQKQKEINDKIAVFQKAAQEAQQDLAKRDNEALARFEAALRGIVGDVAKQEKLSFVIDRNQSGLVWVDEPVDITEKVMKAYEAKSAK